MKRILFVDDESNILEGIRRMLHADRDRWDLQFAVGGEAALQACAAGNFDVVFSDMRMPGMDGATLLGHIRDRFPATVRCILSGYSDTALTLRAIPVAHRVLAKPFKGSELQATIERICTLQDLLCTPELRRVMGTIGALPSLSNTYLALNQAVRDPATHVQNIACIIEQDVAMSAKVLQLVNSGFFGLAQRIANLERAVLFLGMETIRNLALASETFRVFAAGLRIPQSVYESMQEHAQLTAGIAGTFPINPEDHDVLVISALLHDIGKLVLANKMPEEFCAAISLAKKRKCKDFEAEEELLGISHAEVGAYLLGLWGMDNLVVEAIAHHHRPTRIPHTTFDCSAAVYVADLLAHHLEDHPVDIEEVELDESDRACLDTLGALQQFSGFRECALQRLG
jgi:putative nucleotidyltransferase with HDIG domain